MFNKNKIKLRDKITLALFKINYTKKNFKQIIYI